MAGAAVPPGRVVDLGGRGEVLHVGHANGFPPGTYRPLLRAIGDGYHALALPARPLWPGSRPDGAPTWQPMVHDLVAALDGLGLRGIAAVGHSLGAVLTLLAAVRRPDLFRAVVLIDPVILPPGRLRGLRLLRLLRLAHRLPLAQAALRRRRVWPSREACRAHLASRAFFATWPPDSLDAYVEAGTRPRPDGQVELVYPPEWEAHIFATTPTDLWRYIPRLRVPSLWIRGGHSPTFCAGCLARVSRLLPAARLLTIPDAAHMVPLERPVETGRAIREFLAGSD